jgi:hypothetical protein
MTFRKLHLLPSSGEGKEISALLSPLQELSLSPLILNIIYHHQNP